MATISLQDIELWTHIGITKEERMKEQRMLVSVWLETEEKGHDEMSVDYQPVYNAIRETAKTERSTIEKLAADIADRIVQQNRVKHVNVAIRKFALPGTESSTFVLERP